MVKVNSVENKTGNSAICAGKMEMVKNKWKSVGVENHPNPLTAFNDSQNERTISFRLFNIFPSIDIIR
jgi:hypothetical protein